MQRSGPRACLRHMLQCSIMTACPSPIPPPRRPRRPPPVLSPRQVTLILFALAMGGFAIGTSEFVVMGLITEIARSLGVSEPQVGHVISAYALGVVVGAPTLAILGARMSRRSLLLCADGLLCRRQPRQRAGAGLPHADAARASSPACRTAPTSASPRWSPRASARPSNAAPPWAA